MMTFREIGEVMGCSDRAAFQVYTRALEKFRVGLEQRGVDVSDLVQVAGQQPVFTFEEEE